MKKTTTISLFLLRIFSFFAIPILAQSVEIRQEHPTDIYLPKLSESTQSTNNQGSGINNVQSKYSAIRYKSKVQQQQQQQNVNAEDCTSDSSWRSIYNNKIQLPIFDNAAHLHQHLDWEKYLNSVYGNSLTFPLDLRDFTFFWNSNWLRPPKTILDKKAPNTWHSSKYAVLGEFMFEQIWQMNSDAPELIHVYGDASNQKQVPIIDTKFMKKQIQSGQIGFDSNTKVEVYHECCDPPNVGLWFLLVKGSGIYFNLGNTITFYTHVEASIYFNILTKMNTFKQNNDTSSSSYIWWKKASDKMATYRSYVRDTKLNMNIALKQIGFNSGTFAKIDKHVLGDPRLFGDIDERLCPDKKINDIIFISKQVSNKRVNNYFLISNDILDF